MKYYLYIDKYSYGTFSSWAEMTKFLSNLHFEHSFTLDRWVVVEDNELPILQVYDFGKEGLVSKTCTAVDAHKHASLVL